MSALVFKTTADPYAGRLTYFRVFSGTLFRRTRRSTTAPAGSESGSGPLLVPVGRKQAGRAESWRRATWAWCPSCE